ncbi:MAG: hypothetical protein ACOYXR_04875 [Nitrospirota bacterium]
MADDVLLAKTAIDAAVHLVRIKHLGLPQESREAFTLLRPRAAAKRQGRVRRGGRPASLKIRGSSNSASGRAASSCE